MRAYSQLRTGIVALASAGLFWPACARAQDPVKVGPEIYKVLLENEHVRVCDVSFKPGAKIGMHAHPDHVVYMVSGEKLRLSYPDGTAKELKGKPGTAIWIAAESHAAENTGAGEFHAVVFELKYDPPGPADAGAKLKEVPPHSTVLLETGRVRVIETRIEPGAKSDMHAHPANVIYALSAAQLRFTSPEGKTSDGAVQSGEAIWSEPVTHAVENTGTTDAHVLHVELKDLEQKPAEPEGKTGR